MATGPAPTASGRQSPNPDRQEHHPDRTAPQDPVRLGVDRVIFFTAIRKLNPLPSQEYLAWERRQILAGHQLNRKEVRAARRFFRR